MNQPPSESIRAAANTIRAINNATGDNASHTGISPHDLDILATQRANAETEERGRVTSAARELAGILNEASASSAINEDLTVQDCAEIAHVVIDAGYTRDEQAALDDELAGIATNQRVRLASALGAQYAPQLAEQYIAQYAKQGFDAFVAGTNHPMTAPLASAIGTMSEALGINPDDIIAGMRRDTTRPQKNEISVDSVVDGIRKKLPGWAAPSEVAEVAQQVLDELLEMDRDARDEQPTPLSWPTTAPGETAACRCTVTEDDDGDQPMGEYPDGYNLPDWVKQARDAGATVVTAEATEHSEPPVVVVLGTGGGSGGHMSTWAQQLPIAGAELPDDPTEHDPDNDIFIAHPGQLKKCGCVKVPAMGHHEFVAGHFHPSHCALCGYRQSNVRHEPQTNDEAGQ